MMVQSEHVCRECLVQHQVEVPTEDGDRYLDWRNGKINYIQDALPNMSADDRDVLLTGLCTKAWDAVFVADECPEDCDGSSHAPLFCK